MRQARWRQVLILALTAMAAACAPRARLPASAALPPALTAAPVIDAAALSALLDRGCYACLERAFAAAQQRGAAQQAFEAAALLVLRSKELGLPPDRWLDEARTLAGEDSTRRLLLEMVASVAADPLSGSRELALTSAGAVRGRRPLPMWLDALKTAQASEPFAVYLELALTCRWASADDPGERIASLPSHVRETPLVAYALGICGSQYAEPLRELRARDADFVDADYALARYAVQRRENPDYDEGLRLLHAAATAFPASPAIVTTMGNVQQTLEEWQDAREAYDAALALVPDHPHAMLGRTISLSHLGQHEAAIASATRLIEGGRWFLGQAFYWRSWNRYTLLAYPAARADADRAGTLMVNASLFVLSGLIEWSLHRLDTAEHELEAALGMDAGHCEAAALLGGVRRERAKRPEAVAAFIQARQCYDLTIAVRREAIKQREAGPGSAAGKARDIARHERTIAEAERRRADAIRAVEELAR